VIQAAEFDRADWTLETLVHIRKDVLLGAIALKSVGVLFWAD
jgi:hypothetical protein